MNKEEIEQTYKKLFEAVRRDNYEEALRINQLLYEDTYRECNQLLDKRKKTLSNEEKIRIDRSINLCKTNLEKMVASAKIIQEINLSKDKNEPQ